MIERTQLESFLNELMHIDEFEDYGPNGLQIEGKSEIKKLAVSVSFSLEVAQAAVNMKADAILVHHGHYWKNTSPVITGAAKKRIAELIKNDISLFAYHLPMDFLPLYGNNHAPITALGVGKPEPFVQTGYSGDLKTPFNPGELIQWLEKYYKTGGTYIIPSSEKKIRNVTFVSGGGQSYLPQAVEIRTDAFITGEGSEWVYNMARENDVMYCAMGHYATEKTGPALVAELLKEKFNIDYEFIAEDNPF